MRRIGGCDVALEVNSTAGPSDTPSAQGWSRRDGVAPRSIHSPGHLRVLQDKFRERDRYDRSTRGAAAKFPIDCDRKTRTRP